MKNKYIKLKRDGKVLEIKFSKKLTNKLRFDKPSKIEIKFYNDEIEGVAYHIPNTKFNNIPEIIEYFYDNQTSKYLKVKVLRLIEE